MADRKHAFQEFINELRVKEKEDARERKLKQRDAFIDLLKEQGKELHYLSKYYLVMKKL